MDIRTTRGKLVGVYDDQANTLCIKAQKKEWLFQVPMDGLAFKCKLGDGKAEDLFVPMRQGMERRSA